MPTYTNLATIMTPEKTLIKYGLNEKQAKVYLATLELGSSSVHQISKKANLARSTCYEVLEYLLNKSLVSTYRKKNIKYYSAEDPRKMVDMATEKVEVLKKALPQFNALYGQASARPTVRFYQGKQGMKLILAEILKEAHELLCFTSADDLFSALNEEMPDFVKKRISKKIPIRVILRDSAKAQERKKLATQELRQVKIISPDYEYHGLIYVWGTKIAMFSFDKDLTALVIESKELSNVQKTMFELMWGSIE